MLVSGVGSALDIYIGMMNYEYGICVSKKEDWKIVLDTVSIYLSIYITKGFEGKKTYNNNKCIHSYKCENVQREKMMTMLLTAQKNLM